MEYSVTGTAGTDVLNPGTETGPGTVVGRAGDDCIFSGTGVATVTGDSGNDTVVLQTGNTGTVNGGTENDSLGSGFNVGSLLILGGDGADLIGTPTSTSAQTIVGGNDSNDGNDIRRAMKIARSPKSVICRHCRVEVDNVQMFVVTPSVSGIARCRPSGETFP